MTCVLQAASVVKLVDVTLWRVIIKKRKGSLEPCLMAGGGGALQANSVLTGHKSINLLKPKAEGFYCQTFAEGYGKVNNLCLRRRDRRP